MTSILLSPPLALILLLLTGAALTYVLAPLAARGADSERKLEAYACGQRSAPHHLSLDYSQFFPLAFFFTIMHVLVLVVATAPADALTMPILYVVVGVLALVIIFRR